ncbi:type II secretion system F family protein [Gilvimarinus japonicus]|uniref:Type II secretion system F family protein n=1 Tax=Gilvimarinus japonicus TaxID=1796469 RepID=A0ABV7HW96_9GAMM
MPTFSYKAARRDGSLVEGSLEAASQDLVARELRTQGLIVLSVADGQTASRGSGRRGSFNRNRVLSFTSELAVLLRAGLPIDRALKVLIGMSANHAEKAIMEDILASVKGGKGFSHALKSYPELFDDFYINMVRSGEAGGSLSSILGRLADQLDKAKQVRSGVVSALIYPAILAIVAVISVLVMLGFVVPQFETLFADMGDALPILTVIVIAGGEFVKANGVWLMLIVGTMIYVGRRWVKTSKGKLWLDRRMLRVPMLGSVVFKYETSRFARTMGTLLGSGVSVLQSLNIAVSTVSNEVVRGELETLAPEVKRGGHMSQALVDSGRFSPLLIQMVKVGEESGQLDEMLLELARVYDDEVSAGVKRSLTLLEPLLILGMGGVIGVIIVAILMGILSVNDLAV